MIQHRCWDDLIKGLPLLSDLAWASHILFSAPLLSQASYCLMGNCCCSPDTVPSEPAPSPRVTQGVIPRLVQSRHNMERPLVSSPQLSRTRSRTTSEPESTHHGGMSSQVPNPRSRTKSAPQRPQSSRSPSPQNPRIRAETLSAPKRSSPPLTRGYPKGELLRSIVMQVRTDPLEYVT